MDKNINFLGLDVPTQDPDKKSKFAVSTKELMKWRSLLPMADTGATAKKVFIALREINKTVIPAKTRFEMLELMRPPLQLVCQALRKHYINQTTALSKQKLTIANLAKTLQTEITFGYKIIIEEINKNEKIDLSKDMLPTAIYRTMYYFNCILLRCYQLYSPPPVGVWKELNILYKYANQKNIITHKIKTTIKKDDTYTILTIYKHCLMLAASNPYQWRQTEQEVINNSLDIWAQYATLRPAANGDNKKPSLYSIDLDQDNPPFPSGLNNILINKNFMVLDLSREVEHIKSILKYLEQGEIKAKMAHDGNPEYCVAAATLQKILKDWSSLVQREHNRFNISGSMDASFGLSATHYFVSGKKKFNPEAKQTKKKPILAEEPLSTNNNLPTFDIDENEEEEENINAKYSLEPSTSDTNANLNNNLENKPETKKDEFSKYSCDIVNISPAGCCLNWAENEDFPPIQAGEIIGVLNISATEKENNHWAVGVIRWLKHNKKNKLRIGIQLLSPHAQAVGAQNLRNGLPAGYFLRTLLLPKIDSLNINANIITPTLPFKSNSSVFLSIDHLPELAEAKLIKQIDATGCYRQFEYTSADLNQDQTNDQLQQVKPENINPTESENSNKLGQPDEYDEMLDEDFGDIWDDI